MLITKRKTLPGAGQQFCVFSQPSLPLASGQVGGHLSVLASSLHTPQIAMSPSRLCAPGSSLMEKAATRSPHEPRWTDRGAGPGWRPTLGQSPVAHGGTQSRLLPVSPEWLHAAWFYCGLCSGAITLTQTRPLPTTAFVHQGLVCQWPLYSLLPCKSAD